MKFKICLVIVSCILVIQHLSYRKKHLKPKLKKLRPKKAFYKRPVFLVIIGITTILLAAYFILFSKAVQTSNIEITGNQKIDEENLKKFVWDKTETKILNWRIFRLAIRSFFTIKIKNLENALLSEFPSIEKVEVKKDIFRRAVSVNVTERTFFAVFCQDGENCFLMDAGGIVFEKSENRNDSFVIRNEKLAKNIVLGKEILEKNTVDYIDIIQKNLKSNFEIGIKDVIVGNPLIVETTENWRIYFDPEENVRIQVAKMNALLEKEIPPETRKKIQYIYLQYKDRAYYK